MEDIRIWFERLLDGAVAVKKKTKNKERMESGDEIGALLHERSFKANSGGKELERFSVFNWFLKKEEILQKYSVNGFELGHPTIDLPLGMDFHHLRIAFNKASNKLDSLPSDSDEFKAIREFVDELRYKMGNPEVRLRDQLIGIEFIKSLTFGSIKIIKDRDLKSRIEIDRRVEYDIRELHTIGIKDCLYQQVNTEIQRVLIVTWFGDYFGTEIEVSKLDTYRCRPKFATAMSELLKFWDSKDDFDGRRVCPLTIERRLSSGLVKIKGEYLCGEEIIGIDEDYELEQWCAEKASLAEALCFPSAFDIESKVVFDAVYSTRHIGPTLGMTKKKIKEAGDDELKKKALEYHLGKLEDKYWEVKEREEKGVLRPMPGARYLNSELVIDPYDVQVEEIMKNLEKRGQLNKVLQT